MSHYTYVGSGKAAIHPNGSNFRRAARLDVVARARKLKEGKLLKEKPPWMEWCERVPPMENHNLLFQAKTIRNPYPQMLNFLLKKYPDLRFQDCYVDGNDWSVGNDSYRADHPAMQFVARQLNFMRTEGLNKREAFEKTADWFRERRDRLEQEQKVQMAMALNEGFVPMFSTGQAYLREQLANNEAAHLQNILQELRRDRKTNFHFLEGDLVWCRPEGTNDPPAELCEVISVKDGLVTLRSRNTTVPEADRWVRTLGRDKFGELRIPAKEPILRREEMARLRKEDAVRSGGVSQELEAAGTATARARGEEAVQQAMKPSAEEEEAEQQVLQLAAAAAAEAQAVDRQDEPSPAPAASEAAPTKPQEIQEAVVPAGKAATTPDAASKALFSDPDLDFGVFRTTPKPKAPSDVRKMAGFDKKPMAGLGDDTELQDAAPGLAGGFAKSRETIKDQPGDPKKKARDRGGGFGGDEE